MKRNVGVEKEQVVRNKVRSRTILFLYHHYRAAGGVVNRFPSERWAGKEGKFPDRSIRKNLPYWGERLVRRMAADDGGRSRAARGWLYLVLPRCARNRSGIEDLSL